MNAPPPPIGLSSLNKSIGAARHRDLFRVAPDPVEERKQLTRESRTLGLGFLVVFTGIFGLIALSLNGLWNGGYAIDIPAEHLASIEAKPYTLAITRGDQIEFLRPAQTQFASSSADPPPAKALQDLTPVHLYANRRYAGSLYYKAKLGPEVDSFGLTIDSEGSGLVVTMEIEPSPKRALKNVKAFVKVLMTIGVFMGSFALVAPVLLIPFYKFWMKYVTAPLGWFNTRLILGLVFFLMLTPMAIFRQLFAADPLRRKPKSPDESYWIPREQQREDRHFERLF